MRAVSKRVVALGGGHGLYASLSALRRVTRDLTAVVTVLALIYLGYAMIRPEDF